LKNVTVFSAKFSHKFHHPPFGHIVTEKHSEKCEKTQETTTTENDETRTRADAAFAQTNGEKTTPTLGRFHRFFGLFGSFFIYSSKNQLRI